MVRGVKSFVVGRPYGAAYSCAVGLLDAARCVLYICVVHAWAVCGADSVYPVCGLQLRAACVCFIGRGRAGYAAAIRAPLVALLVPYCHSRM